MVEYVPLGGDGLRAPFAAYAITAHSVTGAVGGGAATLTINMDVRFCSLVSWISLANVQVASADADYRMALFGTGGRIPVQTDSGLITAIAADVSSSTAEKLWEPVPTVLPGASAPGAAIQVRMLNVDSDVYSISSMIYLFNIRVRELTPMGPLLWARGSR